MLGKDLTGDLFHVCVEETVSNILVVNMLTICIIKNYDLHLHHILEHRNYSILTGLDLIFK